MAEEQKRRAPSTAWDQETAKEMGRRGAAARAANRARREKDPGFAMREDLKNAVPDLTRDLLKAARGQHPFADLPPDKRLAALFKALEYAVGRPTVVDKQPPPDAATKEEGGGAEQAGGIEFS